MATLNGRLAWKVKGRWPWLEARLPFSLSRWGLCGMRTKLAGKISEATLPALSLGRSGAFASRPTRFMRPMPIQLLKVLFLVSGKLQGGSADRAAPIKLARSVSDPSRHPSQRSGSS
jgi:hypothetical protein